jgi:YD repeat-containing protein
VANGPHSQLSSTLRYDGHGRRAELIRRIKLVNNLDSISTRWTYLATGQVAQQTISHSGSVDQVKRLLQYDSLGRLVLNIEPNTSLTRGFFPCGHGPYGPPPHCPSQQITKAWHYVYDDAGHMVGTSDARGCGENLFFDNLGRLLAEDFSPCRSYQPDYTIPNPMDGTGTESFFRYDLPEQGETQDYGSNPQYLLGHLVAISDRSTHTRFAWDGRGRMIGIARQLAKPGVADPVLSNRYAPWWFRKARSYDVAGRISQQSSGADVPELLGSADSFSNVVLQYSARGLLTNITGSYGTLVSGLRYDESASLTDLLYGDVAATREHVDYDQRQT